MKRLTILFAALVLSLHLMAENYLELASQAWNENNYEAVIEYVTLHLNTSPRDAQAYMYRATAYAFSEEYGKALKDATQAIAYWNKKCEKFTLADAFGLRAAIYEQIEEFDKALADYNTAVKKDKNNIEAYTNRAEFYYRMEEYVLAESDYRKASAMQPDNSEWQIEVARCLLAQSKWEDAYRVLNPLTKLEPRNEEAQRLLSLAYLYQGDTQKCIDHYLVYLDLADNGDINLLLLAAANEYKYAVKAVTRMLNNADYKPYWYGVRARIYRENGHYEEAIADLKKMEQAYGDSITTPFLFYQLAKCYEGLYDYPKAIKYHTKLITYLEQNQSADASSYMERADAYCNNGEIEKALADADRALEIAAGGISFIYYARGWFYDMARNYDAAFEEYNKAIKADDGVHSTMYVMRGRNYLLQQQDTVRAYADFEMVLQMDTVPDKESSRHYALMYMGRTAEAKTWMNRILEANPEDAGMHYDAACLYARMGEREQAIAYLRKAMELGYRAFVHIVQDNDLDSIRDDAEFRELILQYRKEKVGNLFNALSN